MSKKVVQKVRGMRDILPAEQKYFMYLRKAFETAAEQSGFNRIYTPTVEPATLFERTVGKSTDIVEKEMYAFKSKSGKKVALRPEGTASVARAYLENGMTSWPQPVKLYYEMPMFRYDRPQAGRYREHWQFGVEAFGEKSPLLDVTVIALALRAIKTAGLSETSLQINSIGCPNCRPKYKRILTRFLKENEKELCADCKRRIKTNPLRTLDCKEKKCQEVTEGAPQMVNNLCNTCHEHFKVILEYLDALDIVYEINPRLVRGLDYYIQTVFEIWNERDGGQSALGGGGRYDGLTELLGARKVPGIGFGLGADRIVAAMMAEKVEIPEGTGLDVFVVQLGKEAKKKCFKLMFDLQNAGVGAEGSIDKGSMSAQLKMANRLKVPYAIIIGQKEAYSDTVILKDMDSGCQEIYPQDKIVRELEKRISKLQR
ncbi:MAG: histidine--tRNA ligase [Patescibacteria group bacterium]|nr:histidine--tRNA ligase [Patescibacteria group bacterium]